MMLFWETANLIELMHVSNGPAQLGCALAKGHVYDAGGCNIGFAEGLVEMRRDYQLLLGVETSTLKETNLLVLTWLGHQELATHTN